jgi:hypothetical protein
MSALPTEAFESLLPSLLEIFALVEHSSEVPADKVVQHKHAIAQAVRVGASPGVSASLTLILADPHFQRTDEEGQRID